MSDNRPRINQRKAVDLIPKREGFRAGELTARTVEDGGFGPFDTGRMVGADEQVWRDECYDIDYVVFSFVTPIAWHHRTNGWYVVKQRFSPITSTKHQSRLYMIPDNGQRTARR